MAAVGTYDIRVFWGEVYNNIPALESSIKTVLSYSASAVSGVKIQ